MSQTSLASPVRVSVESAQQQKQGEDVFLHKAPAWVRYTPLPARQLKYLRPYNAYRDAPVLAQIAPQRKSTDKAFHPALYANALQELQSTLGKQLKGALRSRVLAHLQNRQELLAFYRAQHQQMLVC